MKALSVFAFTFSMAMAQNAAPAPSVPDLPNDAVIAVFDDGVKFTMGDFRNLYAALPDGNQQSMLRNRKLFLEQYAFLRKLAQMAEADKLDQASPNKEVLSYNRMVLLSQMKLNAENQKTVVNEEDVKKFYEANQSQYHQVRVKAIYIAFTRAQASQSNNGKQLLTEEEARAKAQKLRDGIRKGADFVKLVRENSDDPASREKDGDFATLHPTDTIPEPIKLAVFSLKQGEVTDPIEQPNGFYLIRAEEVSTRPLAEVHGEIYTTLQQEISRKWMQTAHDSVKVQFPNAEFVSEDKAAAPPGK